MHEMNGFIGIIAGLLVVAAMTLILKNFGFKGAPVFVCLSLLFVFSSVSDSLFSIKDTYFQITSYADIGEYSSALMKVVGIGYISGISSDICKEIGEAGVAKSIMVVSKLELIVIALPFVEKTVSLCVELLGG